MPRHFFPHRIFLCFLITVGLIAGCSVNPVTGKKELTLVNEQQELSLGEHHYLASQQSQGGVYTVDPKLNAYINRIGQSLAKVSNRPQLPYEFVVLNNDSANAWALPGGKIAINRGLLTLLRDEAQLAAVLSHEVVHAAARHGANQMSRGLLLQWGSELVQSATNNRYYSELATYGAAAFQARYSRAQELEADHYGIVYMVKAGYDPMAAVELQQTFVQLLQSNGESNHWLNALFASHPPSQARVAANRLQANHLSGGQRNQQAYRRAIRQLLNDKVAYQAHRESMAAANRQQWRQAVSLTDKAIAAQPKEALFWITRARLQERNNSERSALRSYGTAIRLNHRYFAGYLHRGLLYHKLKQHAKAKGDLLTSNGLLETQPANFYLAEIALGNGQRQTAIDYYRKVADNRGELGQAALQRLQTLNQ